MVLRVQRSSKIKFGEDLFQNKDNDTVKTSTNFNIDLKEAKRLDGENMTGLVLERIGDGSAKNENNVTAPKNKTAKKTMASQTKDTTVTQKSTHKSKAKKSKTDALLQQLMQDDIDATDSRTVEEKTKEVKESIIANQKKKTEQMKKARQKDKVATTVKASNGLTYEQINMKLTEIVNKTLLPLACDTNGDNAHIMSIEEAWEYAQKIGGPLLAKMEPLMKARKELEKKYPILTDKDADNVVVIVGPNGKRSYWSKEPLLF